MLVVFSPMKLVNRDRYDFLSCASKSPLRSVTRKEEHQTPNVWYRKAKPGKPGQNSRRETPMQIVVRPSLGIKTAPIFRGRDTAPGAFLVSKTTNSEEVSIVFFIAPSENVEFSSFETRNLMSIKGCLYRLGVEDVGQWSKASRPWMMWLSALPAGKRIKRIDVCYRVVGARQDGPPASKKE